MGSNQTLNFSCGGMNCHQIAASVVMDFMMVIIYTQVWCSVLWFIVVVPL